MHQIFLGPWSEWHVQLLLEELFMALVSQVFFSLQGSQQCCCVPGQCYRGAKHLPDRAHRCSVPCSLVSDPEPELGPGLCV